MSTDDNLMMQLQDIHSSWIETIPNGILLEKLRKNATEASPNIMNLVKQHISIEDIKINSENSLLVRALHLKTPAELKEIVLKAGAVQLSKKFSQVISQHDVKRIKASLGNDLYNFCLHEAPIIFPEFDFSQVNMITTNLNPLVHVIDAGYNSLCISLADTSNNCMLKLPKHWSIEYFKNKKSKIDQYQRSFHMDLFMTLIQMEAYEKSESEVLI